MSAEGQRSVFLERRSYRQRRLMDALRLLPVFGLMLCMLPLFWPSGEAAEGQVSMSAAIIYVFSIWGLLILISCALSILLRRRLNADIGASDDLRGE